MTVIQGFAARLECMLNTCVRHASTVSFKFLKEICLQIFSGFL